MVGSLLYLRNLVGALDGYDRNAEPVLYHQARVVGAQWPCGCLACGAGFEFLELVMCKKHYRAGVVRPGEAVRNRRMQGERRRYPRAS